MRSILFGNRLCNFFPHSNGCPPRVLPTPCSVSWKTFENRFSTIIPVFPRWADMQLVPSENIDVMVGTSSGLQDHSSKLTDRTNTGNGHQHSQEQSYVNTKATTNPIYIYERNWARRHEHFRRCHSHVRHLSSVAPSLQLSPSSIRTPSTTYIAVRQLLPVKWWMNKIERPENALSSLRHLNRRVFASIGDSLVWLFLQIVFRLFPFQLVRRKALPDKRPYDRGSVKSSRPVILVKNLVK